VGGQGESGVLGFDKKKGIEHQENSNPLLPKIVVLLLFKKILDIEICVL